MRVIKLTRWSGHDPLYLVVENIRSIEPNHNSGAQVDGYHVLEAAEDIAAAISDQAVIEIRR